MDDRYLISDMVTDDDLKNLIEEALNKGNIPRALCHHHITNTGEPKFSLFLNIRGVNSIIGGCSNYCIADTMVMLMKNDRLRCLECRVPFTLESTMKVRHDNYNNGYLYCSQECFDKSPTIITRCPHNTAKDFINAYKSLYYMGDNTSVYGVKLCCKKCPFIISAHEKFHCYVCKNVITFTRNIALPINKAGCTYLVCNDVCNKKLKQLNYNVCQKCGLYGNKQCANCKTFYCSRECQKNDWEVHKSTCTKTRN